MVHSARLAVLALGLFALSSSYAFGTAQNPRRCPGLSADGDAACRAAYQKAESSWRPSYLSSMRKLHSKWNELAPVEFYRRTCGKGPRSRQVIVRLSKFNWSAVLKDDASQLAFLLYVRWLIEVYWRRVVPFYRLEPKPVFIIDFDGVSWRTFISYSLSINSLIKKMNGAFHGITGKGWAKTYILNPPSCFSSIWSAVTSFVTFRNEGVVVVKDEAMKRQLVEDTGIKCLWEGLGGKSKMPLGSGVVADAFNKYVEADASVVSSDEDFVRLNPEAENFPLPEDIAKLQEQLATEAAAVASKAAAADASNVSSEAGAAPEAARDASVVANVADAAEIQPEKALPGSAEAAAAAVVEGAMDVATKSENIKGDLLEASTDESAGEE